MLRKSTLFALAASAVLGLAVLAPAPASAFGGHGGGHGMHGGGHGMHGGHFGGFRGGHFRVSHFHGHHRWRWHRHRHYVRWHRPLLYSVPVAYGVARAPAPGPCTCLTKEYTQEGAVLFKDRCTSEMAINPPLQTPGPAAEVIPPEPPQTTVK